MKLDQCFQLGMVLKPHGLKGELYISLDTDYPEDYQELESVFLLQNGKLVPFFIEHIQLKNKEALVKFEDVEDKEGALALRGSTLHLPLTELPELTGNQFYFHEISGFQIEDTEKGMLGVVKEVFEAGHQDLIGMDYKGKEVLIPINDDVILNVDRENSLLKVSLPEGLLELYMEEEEKPDEN
ncbi:ribosome maturation factor RimM [Marivirga tractuosa]|jgi:16S rRNA processing protein RimM|uniref:Ribosome maturation factor RimM n=1 Tax=Marivirga tractuosa (strain ATCC 23168 / DSM 4126 / NBRC 15989 / NCIMB 1408 / VKM B-1430 / H-43) TaxID=643867 RepID=E4TRJ5_MARTH|nr:ribosome maturation factor RimM [Marivirga tractuosa]ADR21716.1 16S rRNA processing protein RimM [Marivirga tractuosa DSM 4126]RUA34185.1 MAG: 16S rRNA processing protein RimM [Bacteroidota bacterium]BDD13826.1 ribosome maturation factor RimM [Marivirga tractuosa]